MANRLNKHVFAAVHSVTSNKIVSSILAEHFSSGLGNGTVTNCNETSMSGVWVTVTVSAAVAILAFVVVLLQFFRNKR